MNLDYIMWLFTRISGLALALLALTGFIGAMLMGARLHIDLPTMLRWTFFPNPNHVVNSNIPDVTVGWATAFWQVMQMLIVIFGSAHGFNGLRTVIEDYLENSFLQIVVRGLIFLTWLYVAITAIYVILAS
jgi:succinate dehydrogenase hydrophobic anchor subunit